MPVSAPFSSLKPFEWPPKFCTNCQRRKVNGMLNSRREVAHEVAVPP